MIRLEEDRTGRGRWTGLLGLSLFLHASIIGALVLVPEQTIRRFTSAMDFSVVKEEKKAPPPRTVEPPRKPEPPKPAPVKIKKAKAPETPPEVPPPPPPPEPKKFEMSETSFDGEGTWGINAEIGENRIGSFSGTKDGTGKTASASGQDQPKEEPKPPKPKKVVVKDKPKVLEEVTIPYPAEAKKLEITGDVKLKVTVNEKGVVTAVTVIQDPGGGLGEAAAKALKKFRFAPAMTDDGKAVPYTITYIYSFVLD